MRIKIIFLAWLLLCLLPPASTPEGSGEQEAVSGLQETPVQNVSAAIGALAVGNCFPDNAPGQNPCQPEASQPESALSATHSLFTISGTPSVQDAKSILAAGDTEATGMTRKIFDLPAR